MIAEKTSSFQKELARKPSWNKHTWRGNPCRRPERRPKSDWGWPGRHHQGQWRIWNKHTWRGNPCRRPERRPKSDWGWPGRHHQGQWRIWGANWGTNNTRLKAWKKARSQGQERKKKRKKRSQKKSSRHQARKKAKQETLEEAVRNEKKRRMVLKQLFPWPPRGWSCTKKHRTPLQAWKKATCQRQTFGKQSKSLTWDLCGKNTSGQGASHQKPKRHGNKWVGLVFLPYDFRQPWMATEKFSRLERKPLHQPHSFHYPWWVAWVQGVLGCSSHLGFRRTARLAGSILHAWTLPPRQQEERWAWQRSPNLGNAERSICRIGHQGKVQQHGGVHVFCSREAIFPTSQAERSCRWNSTFHPYLGIGGLEEGQWLPSFCTHGWMLPSPFQILFNHCRGWFLHEKRWKESMVHYIWLHNHFDDGVRFTLTPKCHFLAHIALMLHFQNPATCWTYKQESFMGYIATLGHSCPHGTRAVRLSESFITFHYQVHHGPAAQSEWYGLEAWEKARGWQESSFTLVSP